MKEITKKLFRILTKKQRVFAGVMVVLMLIGGLLESLSVSLMLPLVTAVMDSEGWSQSGFGKVAAKIFGISEIKQYVILLLSFLIVAFIVKNAFLLLEYYIQYGYVCKCRVDLQRKLFKSYLHKPYSFFLSSSTAEIMRIISADSASSFELLSQILSFYTEIIVAISIGVTIIVISPQISIGLMVVLLLEVIIITVAIKPLKVKYGNYTRSEQSNANRWVIQAVSGIKSIKVARSEQFFEDKYYNHAKNVVDTEKKNKVLIIMPRFLIEAFTIAGVLAIMLIMVLNGAELVALVPQLSAFLVAAMRLLPSVNRMTACINDVPFHSGALENVCNVLETVSGEEAQRIATSNVGEEYSCDEAIDFHDVTYEYNESARIFDQANMKIGFGQSIGIVGPSGAGKTTAVDIILGLLMPKSGTVFVDGKDITKDIRSWLKHIAYIPQSIFLMDDTILSNVGFGYNKEDIDEDKVWAALEQAQMKDFVKSLPDQLMTKTGEAGVRLSGGQRQRIGIARALYNNPEVLVFDEATSALDNETEIAIMEAIESLKGEKTLIIIAHRLTTIEKCDVVYRVENGKIVREK